MKKWLRVNLPRAIMNKVRSKRPSTGRSRSSSTNSEESTHSSGHPTCKNVEELVSLHSTPLDRMELLQTLAMPILENLRNFHEQGQTGFEFRPDRMMLSEAGTVVLQERPENEMEEKVSKRHSDQAFRSLLYSSPEMLRGTDADNPEVAASSDIWSFACLCLYILTGSDPVVYRLRKGEEVSLNQDKNPFVAVTMHVGNGDSRPEYRRFCQDYATLEEFFAQCFRYFPEDRPSAAALLESAFFRNESLNCRM